MCRTERQGDGERRAASRLAGHMDRAPMQLDQLLDQREPDAAAFERAAAGALDPPETLEQVRQFLRRDAGAGVAHDDLGVIAALRGSDRDRDLAVERELERV